jgi:5-methylcytosine-specific restriction endonuclease McrA
MYLQNKYTRWYYNIIQRAKNRILKPPYERHHIIPRSLGGNNFKENIVKLTAQEHFVCHLLLTKMIEGKNKEKMVYAAWAMANLENQNQQRHKVTGRIYSILKQEYCKVKSMHTKLNNPMHSPEIRLQHQEAIAKRGKTLGNTGYRRGPMSEELKVILRQKTINSMTSERREQIKQQQLNRTQEQKEKYAFAHSKRMSCIYCRYVCNPGTFARYHGNNCKSK